MNWFEGWFRYDGYLSATTLISPTCINISVPYTHGTCFKFHASDPQEKRGNETETQVLSTDHCFDVETQRGSVKDEVNTETKLDIQSVHTQNIIEQSCINVVPC
jgi:hypothetical protein